MFDLEIYEDIDKKRIITYSSLSEAEKSANAIMKNHLESNTSYCMIWQGKSMIKYVA